MTLLGPVSLDTKIKIGLTFPVLCFRALVDVKKREEKRERDKKRERATKREKERKR